MKPVAISLLFGFVTVVFSDEKAACLDANGDPLPEGAVARLGSARLRHGDAVGFTAFLPGGKTLLSTGADNTIRFWDVATGKETKQLVHTPTAEERASARRAPLLTGLSADGTVLVTGSSGRTLRIWNVGTGRPLRSLSFGSVGANALALSPDGKTLAVSMTDASVRLIETTSGKELRTVEDEKRPRGFAISGVGMRLAFTPDSKTLVFLGYERAANLKVEKSLRAWNVADGKLLYRVAEEAPRARFGSALAVSPDGKQLLVSGLKGSLYLLESATGKEIRDFKADIKGIDSVLFSGDGKRVIARALHEGVFGIWDVADGKAVALPGKPAPPDDLARARYLTHGGTLGGVSLSADNRVLACPEGNRVRLLDLTTGKDVFAATGHYGAINRLRFFADGKTLLSQSLDGSLRLWDPATGKQTGEVKVPTDARPIVLSPDGKCFVAVGKNDMPCLVNATTGQTLYEMKHAQPASNDLFVFSPDSRRLAIHLRSVFLTRVYSVETGKLLATFDKRDPKLWTLRMGTRYAAMAFSPDGALLAVAGPEMGLLVWDVDNGLLLSERTIPTPVHLRDLTFSPDGRLVALDLGLNRAFVYEAATSKERNCFLRASDDKMKGGGAEGKPGDFPIGAVPTHGTLAFSNDGRRLALAAEGAVIHVWDVLTGDNTGKLSGPAGEVRAIAFSPDGLRLAAGGLDSLGLVWDLTALKANKAPAVALNEADLEVKWNMLAAADGAGVFAAIAALTHGAKDSVPFLDRRLKAVEVDRLIADFDSNRFATRVKAQEELERLGAGAVPALKKALEGATSVDFKKRLKDLLDKLQGAKMTATQVQASRAIEVLERVGSTEAKSVLERLAKGPAWALETKEAKAALTRLK